MPTVQAIYDRARMLLADPNAQEFDDQTLFPAFADAYEEMVQRLGLYGASRIERAVEVTLAGGVKEIDPVAQGWVDFGDPYLVQERGGSGERWMEVTGVSELTPADAGAALGLYEWTGGKIVTNGCTVSRQVRIKYYASGEAPVGGEIGVEGSGRFLAARTAGLALMGREEGQALASTLHEKAEVAMQNILQKVSRQSQQTARIVRPAFRDRRRA